MNKLTPAEQNRYARHLVLENFGIEAQEKVKNAHVLVVGAGGLGCPALQYLAAAGVGSIGIVDFDHVQESNLQRQILFTTDDIGKSKAETAASRLKSLNPFLTIKAYPLKLTSKNVFEVLNGHDIVLDGSDNFPTRYLVNDACVLKNKTLIYGSILQYEGQVAVFNAPYQNSRSTNYRDLFPRPPAPDQVPDCSTAGVLGVLPGVIGSIMAAEAIKLIINSGDVLLNRLLIFDILSLESTYIKIPDRNSRNHIDELIDYDFFCGVNNLSNRETMNEITVAELKAAMDAKEDFQLIDVRELHEYELAHIGGDHIPMAEVPMNVERINPDKKVIIYCRSGGRSGKIIQWLEKNHQFSNLYNLKGGILAWRDQIDSTIEVF